MPDGVRPDDQFRKGGLPTQVAIPTSPGRRWNATAVAILPNFCPECGLMISEHALPEHLITAHDYLLLCGTLLPRSVALTCLWDRVFTTGDAQAHERLCLLLANPPDSKGRVPYVAALEAELQRWLDGGSSGQKREVERLVRWAQANPADYSYVAFCEKVKAAGCAGYLVSFLGRRVVYFGRTAETHVEYFPK